MKLCYAHDEQGGDETIIVTLASSFEHLFHRVQVVTIAAQRERTFNEQFNNYRNFNTSTNTREQRTKQV